MPVYQAEEIIAYKVGEQVVCPECIERDEEFDDVIDESQVEHQNLIVICDRCRKRL